MQLKSMDFFTYKRFRFPLDNNIRIAYTLFILEDINSPNMALPEIRIIENNNPSLEVEFLTHTYHEIIKEKLLKAKEAEIGKANEDAFVKDNYFLKF